MPYTTELAAQQILSLIDLTELSDTKSNIKEEEDALINSLCEKSITQFGNVAAICVHSRFIQLAKSIVGRKIKIASMINFPCGVNNTEMAKLEAKLALSRGASEIELVFPYKCFMLNQNIEYCDMIQQVKTACGGKKLKVIIETGELGSAEMIGTASELCIKNGADFIQTSTGKTAIGATLAAVEVILNTIKMNDANCGLKISGGIRTVVQAKQYLELVADIMGTKWIKPCNLRFGALSLLGDILNVLNPEETQTDMAYSFGISE